MKPLQSTKTGTTMATLTEIPRENDLAPLLTAWDVAHTAVADPDWRHLLDEMAHPHTTEAFHHLATAS